MQYTQARLCGGAEQREARPPRRSRGQAFFGTRFLRAEKHSLLLASRQRKRGGKPGPRPPKRETFPHLPEQLSRWDRSRPLRRCQTVVEPAEGSPGVRLCWEGWRGTRRGSPARGGGSVTLAVHEFLGSRRSATNWKRPSLTAALGAGRAALAGGGSTGSGVGQWPPSAPRRALPTKVWGLTIPVCIHLSGSSR